MWPLRFAPAIAACVALLVSGPAFAGESLAGVGELILTGRAAEARTRLTSARDAFVAKGDRAGEAATDLLLGFAETTLGDATAARSSLERAASTFIAADEHFGAWLSLTTLARFETESGRPRDAIALHEKALQLLDEAADPQSRLSVTTIEVLGIVFGASPERIQMLAAAPELTKTLRISLAEVVSRIAYGQTLLAVGELEKADDQLTQAAAMGAMFGHMLDGMLATPMGDLRKRQWRFDEARQYYETALNMGVMPMPVIFVRPASVEIDLLGKLAEIDVLTGHVDDALGRNDRERTLARDSEPAREPWIWIERGSLLQQAGRIRDAEKAYREALVAAERFPDVHPVGAVHTELGLLDYYAGNYGKAASDFAKAIEIFQELKEDKVEALLWTLLADVHLAIDSRVSAAEAIARAKELATTSHFSTAGTIADFLDATLKRRQGERADVRGAFAALLADREAQGLVTSDEAKRFMTDIFLMNVGMTPPDSARISGDGVELLQPMALIMRGVPLAASGDYAGARAIWSKATELFSSRDVHAVFEGLIASSYWREGKLDDAIRHFKSSTEILETVASDVRVEEMLTSYLGARHQLYEHLVEMLVREGRTGEAFEETERARARAFLQMIGNRRVGARGADPHLVDQADIQRRRIDAMDQSIRRAPSGEEAALLKRELVAARHEYEALMVRVKVSNPEYAALTTVDTVPLDVIRKELPDRTTMIAYFVTPAGVHAWIIDRATVDYVRLPIDTAALRRITCWARQFSPPEDDAGQRGVMVQTGPCRDAATADEAYAMLIAPLRAKIRHQRLVIVPHRELHYVPFAALHDAESGCYLIEDYTIVYAPSATAWRFLRRHEPPVSGRALVLGDPAGSIGPLKGAAQEARMVAGRLGTTALLGTEACERLLRDLDPRIDLLHIAAHARYDGANPLFSFIALAPEGEQYDGNLEAQEILADVDLTRVNLVVVSACSTAAGKPSAGDEIVGLTRALLYAGTPAVLSTLWEIDDIASTTLMDKFYERFVSGEPAADALRDAQLAMLRDEVFQSPRFWAAFSLHGDPGGTWRRERIQETDPVILRGCEKIQSDRSCGGRRPSASLRLLRDVPASPRRRASQLASSRSQSRSLWIFHSL
jgi:CHAT domain-containing protein/tetratricopeptide (TPR) repeat protein